MIVTKSSIYGCAFMMPLQDKDVTVVEEGEYPLIVLKAIENIIKKEGYMDYSLNKRIILSDGAGYTGKHYEFDVKGVTNDGSKETNIFVKYIINTEQLKDVFSVQQAYITELFLYKELFGVYERLQDEANVPAEDRYKTVKSYDESDSNAIILQNMIKIGYKTWNRMDLVTLKLTELSIEQLAKFHALSFVLEKRDQEYFSKYVKDIKIPFLFSKNWKSAAENIADLSIGVLNDELKKKAEAFKLVYIEKFPSYSHDSTLSRSCLCHGDFRANNILYKEKDGEASETIPIDFQFASFGSPINDILYYIFLGTDQKFRREHFGHITDLYLDTLKRFLGYFEMDVESVYPREEFKEDLKRRMDYGLMVAIHYLPFVLASENDIPDVGNEDMSKMNFNLDSRMQERLGGIVSDFIEWGYL